MSFPEEVSKTVIQLRSLESQYVRVSIKAFHILERCDPSTASLAIEAFNYRKRAALWFGDRSWPLGNKTPWECIALGHVERVKLELISIIHGLPV